MGLDLYLFSKRKDQSIDQAFHEDEDELAYGRKTWSLYYFFKEDAEEVETETFKVSEARWNQFIDTISALWKAYGGLDHINYLLEWSYDKDEDAEVTDEDIKNWDELRNLYDDWTDISPQLEKEWELRAVIRWYEADQEVRAAFARGEDVLMLASY